MKDKVDNFLKEKLNERAAQGNLRKLFINNELIDFCSNDYLGLANHPSYNITEQQHGATGSRLITGNSKEAEEAEQRIATFHNAESALIFNTGYMANVGLCSAIGDKSTSFFCDAFIHASTIDGVRMSTASKVKFAHNDVKDLQKKLSASTLEKKIVLVESVYSMNGDIAPLKEIVEVAEANDAIVIVDEAHATGIFGDKGLGLVQALGLEKRIWCRVHTYSKSMGLHGAAVVGSKILIDYLTNFARSFIYATALPPVAYRQITAGYELFAQEDNLLALKEIIKVYCELFNNLRQAQLTTTPIQIIKVTGNENAKACSAYLIDNGIYAKAILSPTVPSGEECIRICLHSFNTSAQITLLHHSLKSFFK